MKQQICPSILSADFSRLEQDIAAVESAGANILHLDIMDGHYVPNISFGPLVVKAVRKVTTLHLEAHLMISEPDIYLQRFIDAGADTVLVHPVTCKNPGETLVKIRESGAKAGLVINPDETTDIIRPYLDKLDQVLFMSVFPGFGGQKFMPSVLPGIRELAGELHNAGIIIEIDGGINSSTLQDIRNDGIDLFVAGSAVFGHKQSLGKRFQQLSALLS